MTRNGIRTATPRPRLRGAALRCLTLVVLAVAAGQALAARDGARHASTMAPPATLSRTTTGDGWGDATTARTNTVTAGAARAHGTTGPAGQERIEKVALVTNLASDGSPFTQDVTAALPAQVRAEARETRLRAGYGLPLPEPDGWAAVVATVALALFFFVRRMV